MKTKIFFSLLMLILLSSCTNSQVMNPESQINEVLEGEQTMTNDMDVALSEENVSDIEELENSNDEWVQNEVEAEIEGMTEPEANNPVAPEPVMAQKQPVKQEPAPPAEKPVEKPALSEDEQLRQRLTSLQYEVTQNWATEEAYNNAYWDNNEEGIYVDIIDGKALFSSTTKFKSDTGWPSFTKPISAGGIREVPDNILWFERTEVKWASSDSHLGHVFTDGPKDQWWLRYCLNSASLRFIPKASMQSQGYGDYLYLFGE